MKIRLNVISRIAVCVFLVILFPQGIKAESLPPDDYKPLVTNEDSTGSECAAIQLDLTATNTMPVPSGCFDSTCKLILYVNDIMGAYSDGYFTEVYYYQWSGTDNWIGGPNIAFGGVQFSDGYGSNGNGIGEGVILGGTTPDGGYVRIMDDGDLEDDPNLWTIESRATSNLTSASLHVCPLTGCEIFNVYEDQHETHIINVPSFCIDGLCMIIRHSWEPMGDFGIGFSFPVFYSQNGQSDSWVGGPNVLMGGVSFSDSSGLNGDGSAVTVFNGGTTAGGEYVILYDDWWEVSDTQWSVDFSGGDPLTLVSYIVCPMACTAHHLSTHANLDVPAFCIDDLCTIVRWTDGWFGAWGPGLSWPVSYKQNSFDNSWIGGPALCIGGQCFSHGSGINGDSSENLVFEGGYTSPNNGYVILQDDDNPYESYSSQWNVEFIPEDGLSAASYYICSNSCEETIFLINKQYLPLNNK